MPTLYQSLKGRDLSYLRMVAERWRIELDAPDFATALNRLVPALLDAELVQEMFQTLPGDARSALEDLLQHDGLMPLPLFSRRYGEVRKMGAARRDRERPDRSPVSPAEALWYRALIVQGFFQAPGDTNPQEYIYIPEDLAGLLPQPEPPVDLPPGRLASPLERQVVFWANDRLLDHAATMLAALRLGWKVLAGVDERYPGQPDDFLLAHLPISESGPGLGRAALARLLASAGLLDDKNQPLPEPTRAFLEAPRPQALLQLVNGWLESRSFDELRLLPHLRPEGDWLNDPVAARQALLAFFKRVPDGAWWSLSSFVTAVREQQPDFQRPSGDFNAFYLRDAAGEGFLQGFEHWERVDGALVSYFISAVLFSLGLVDLAAPAEDARPTAFRKSRWAAALLSGQPPTGLKAEEERIHIRSNGRLGIPALAPRSARYLAARFAAWEVGLPAGPAGPEEYRYRLSPTSLARAADQSLRMDHLFTLLARFSDGIPQNLTKALRAFERSGAQAHIVHSPVLRLGTPEMLQELRRSRAARYLGDVLGPAAVLVRPGAEEKVLEILAELGILGEIR